MTTNDSTLFDAASRQQLVRLLRQRGVFVGSGVTKEELRPLFGLGFGYAEYLALKKGKTK